MLDRAATAVRMEVEGLVDLPEPTDRELIAAVTANDLVAAEELLARHRVPAEALARRLTATDQEADELLSRAFFEAVTSLSSGGGPTSSFRPYFLTLLRDLAPRSTHATPSRVSVEYRNGQAVSRFLVDTRVRGNEDSLAAETWSHLSEEDQAVLWHLAVEATPAAQVAPILGTAPDDLGVALRDAIGRFRETYLALHLQDEVVEPCASNARAIAEAGTSMPLDPDIARHARECFACGRIRDDLRHIPNTLRRTVGPLIVGPATAGLVAPLVPVPGSARSRATRALAASSMAVMLLIGGAVAAVQRDGGGGGILSLESQANTQTEPGGRVEAPAVDADTGSDGTADTADDAPDADDTDTGATSSDSPIGATTTDTADSTDTTTVVDTTGPGGGPGTTATSTSQAPTPDRSPVTPPTTPTTPTPPTTPTTPTTPTLPPPATTIPPPTTTIPRVITQLAVTVEPLGDLVPGRSGALSITATNSGSVDGTDVVVSVAAASGTELGAASGEGWSCAETAPGVDCAIDSVPVGTEVDLVVPLEVSAGAAASLDFAVQYETPGTDPVVVDAPPVATVVEGTPAVYVAEGNLSITTVGNTSLTCPTHFVSCQRGLNRVAQGNGSNVLNDAWEMVDLASSPDVRATYGGRISVPAGGTVRWAGLYWAGDVRNWQRGDKATVQLYGPASTSAEIVNADRVDVAGSRFQAFSDVTQLVAGQPDGAWWATAIANGIGGNRFGAWTLLVVTEDPNAGARRISVFDSLNLITATDALSITIRQPSAYDRTGELTLVAYDGDIGTERESVTLDGVGLSNATSPAGDVFNSTGLDPSRNTFGYDLDTFDVALPPSTEPTRLEIGVARDELLWGIAVLDVDLSSDTPPAQSQS